ncbi:MAG: rhomboid family intramembrane serine protease [bacterium]
MIVINTLVFLYSLSLGAKGFNYFTIQFGFIPYEFVNSIELTPDLPTSAFLTPFSSMFMHGGWMHLIGNMLFLWIFGNNVEDYFGAVRFTIFYLASGLAAIGLYTLFGPDSQVPLIGASGAIAGVMGAYLVLHPKAKITCLFFFFFIQFLVLPAKIVLGLWFGYQLLMSLIGSSSGGGVAWMAHVGGFVFGWILLKLLTLRRNKRGAASDTQRVYRVQW